MKEQSGMRKENERKWRRKRKGWEGKSKGNVKGINM